MKKLLVLLVVLGITSAAGAVDIVDIVISSWGPAGQGDDPFVIGTEPIDPTQEITLYPSEWINLDIVYIDDGSGIGLISLALDIIVTGGPVTLYLGELGPASDNTLLTFPPGAWDLINMPPSQPPISFIGPFDDGTYSTVANIDLSFSAGLMGVPGVPVVALDHILLHCDGVSEVPIIITLVDNPGSNAGGTYNMVAATPGFGPGVTIIPEPMTIALLGLGGLTLLRKRRR